MQQYGTTGRPGRTLIACSSDGTLEKAEVTRPTGPSPTKASIKSLSVDNYDDDGDDNDSQTCSQKRSSCKAHYDAVTGQSFFAAVDFGILNAKGRSSGADEKGTEKREYADGMKIMHDGEVVGDIIRLLGKGGMGSVYELLLADGTSRVAAKAVRTDLELSKQAQLEKDLAREVAIGFSAARGPQIASVVRVLIPLPKMKETSTTGLLVLCDFVDGGDLEEAMHSGEPNRSGDLIEDYRGMLYSEEGAKKFPLTSITRQILLGLSHLHQRGIIHQVLCGALNIPLSKFPAAHICHTLFASAGLQASKSDAV